MTLRERKKWKIKQIQTAVQSNIYLTLYYTNISRTLIIYDLEQKC